MATSPGEYPRYGSEDDSWTSLENRVLRMAIPLVLSYGLMFALAFGLSSLLKFPYADITTPSCAAASHHLELAMAVAIGVFGIASGAALSAVVGPLVEMPVLIGLGYVSLGLRRILYPEEASWAPAVTPTTARRR